MIYAKVDVDLRDNRRARLAGEAMATWTYGLLYSRGQELDGFVDREALRGSWVGERVALKHAEKLVEVGLWEAIDGGWTITNYSKKNETKAAIDERRAIDRERKARKRSERPVSERNPDDVRAESGGSPPGIPGSGSGYGSGSDLSRRDPEPTSEDLRARFAAGTAPAHEALEVFGAAVGEAAGAPFVVGSEPWNGRDIAAVMRHGPKSGALADALAWLRATVASWVAATPDGARSPSKLLAWLNDARPDRRSGTVPRSNRQPHDAGWLREVRERERATGTDDPFGGNT